MGKENYEDIVFTDFSGGLATRVDDNLIEDNQSPDLQNVIFDGKGSFEPRLGQALFGVRSSASGKVRQMKTIITDMEAEIMYRFVDNGTTTWIELYNPQTLKWEILDSAYTTGFDFGQADYDFYTYYCSQKDHQRRWNGICWATSTYADSAYSKVYLSTSAASAIGFLSAGSVVIDGEEVYYSSLSANALSGITFTQSHNGGVSIAQLPTSAGEAAAEDGGWVSASNLLPKGGVMIENDGQIFITNASGVSGNVIYYSALFEPTNYALSAVPGGAGTARYPETAGPINALVDFDEILNAYKKNTIRALKFQEMADGTAGTLEIVERKQIASGPNVGAINQKSVSKVENDVVYVSPTGWVRSMSKTDSGKKISELSQNIRPTVESYNMLSSAGIYFDGKYYLACADGDATVNDIVLVFDYLYGSWTKIIGWNVSDWTIYKNTLFYGASNEIATYQALVDYDDDGSAYNCYWSSKMLDYGIPNEQKRLGYVYLEGYMTTNSKIGVSAYFNGDSNSPVSKTIDGSNTDYVSDTETTGVIGLNTWGKGFFGGSGKAGSAYILKKFRVWCRYSGQSFYNMQLKIGSNSPGFVWKVTHIAPYLEQVPGKKIPPNSVI